MTGDAFFTQLHVDFSPVRIPQFARTAVGLRIQQTGKPADWVRELLCKKSNFVVTCALANKLVRIALALTARQQTYET